MRNEAPLEDVINVHLLKRWWFSIFAGTHVVMQSEFAFTIIFTLEMAAKLVAFGVYGFVFNNLCGFEMLLHLLNIFL